MIVHCTNCTPKDNTRLPEKYNYRAVRISEGKVIHLCPRCRCPEVMIEDLNFKPSYGYNNGGVIDSKQNSN